MAVGAGYLGFSMAYVSEIPGVIHADQCRNQVVGYYLAGVVFLGLSVAAYISPWARAAKPRSRWIGPIVRSYTIKLD